jgi:hypothetical protein
MRVTAWGDEIMSVLPEAYTSQRLGLERWSFIGKLIVLNPHEYLVHEPDSTQT